MTIAEGLTRWLEESPICAHLNGAVYFSRVPAGVTMPWLTVVVLPGGTRKRITPLREEFDVSVDLTLDTPKLIEGWEFMNELASQLQNFRGDMLPAEDVFLQCSPVYDVDGPTQNHRIILPIRARFLSSIAG